jgi:2-polyprenyl-3-methyl-5-hydroxy-6-metoxy-1,4-benzoquinol methylase
VRIPPDVWPLLYYRGVDAGAIPVVLSTPDGEIELTPLASGRTRITLRSNDPSLYVVRSSCETSHPDEVELFLQGVASFGWLCDAISRHEDPDDLQALLKRQLLSYLDASAYRGRRLLDFGCGAGASTFSMATLLPATDIIGLELDPARVELSRKIAARRGTRNVRFSLSPAGDSLPSDLGTFDFIMFSAVYEHLLPNERRALMPQLWALLNPGGVLFVNQTPHRWAPYEHHSTALWGINYLPDRLAHWYARTFSKVNPEVNRSTDWNTHLRGGLRGGTERGITAELLANGHSRGVILQPLAGGYRDRADYWLGGTSRRCRPLKRAIAWIFRICDRLFDTVPASNIDVAVGKELLDGNLAAGPKPRH